MDETKFPTREQKVQFLKSYVEEVSRNLGNVPASDTARYLLQSRGRGSGGKGLTVDQMVEIILWEVDLFLAVPDILWALWSIHRAVYSDIQFGYWVSVCNCCCISTSIGIGKRGGGEYG